MQAMRYKEFTWPNNPARYTLSCERLTAVHKMPMGSYCVQDLSVTYAIMAEAELLTGVWSTTDLAARTVSDDRYTVKLLDGPSIEITVNPGYEDSDAARFAGTYRRYR